MSMRDVADEARVSPRKAAVSLESEEVLANVPVSVGRLDIFGGEEAVVVAATAGSEAGEVGEFCIFFKPSNSGLELGAGREAGEVVGATAGRVNMICGRWDFSD